MFAHGLYLGSHGCNTFTKVVAYQVEVPISAAATCSCLAGSPAHRPPPLSLVFLPAPGAPRPGAPPSSGLFLEFGLLDLLSLLEPLVKGLRAVFRLQVRYFSSRLQLLSLSSPFELPELPELPELTDMLIEGLRALFHLRVTLLRTRCSFRVLRPVLWLPWRARHRSFGPGLASPPLLGWRCDPGSPPFPYSLRFWRLGRSSCWSWSSVQRRRRARRLPRVRLLLLGLWELWVSPGVQARAFVPRGQFLRAGTAATP